ncbi:ATP-binding cassette subfamily B protein [Kribbella voronezhensis]|uniref:ATP-binding cassette subfamily B protein n=1 Tax=Kribbella voronezhensis TaxID=2512212 RepID=A0A4R7TCA3_9ACTN|nr:ABC transporter ATP-binding protein [Kribbella voronezhensis]TDU89704.1 ATP-binding cassette subfamily B protein [Kribbella voronezhensis]
MTRSDDLPKAIPAMWRLCKLGYQHEPGLLVFAFAMTLLAALPDALLALWLKVLADGVLRGDRRAVFLAAAGMALSVTATWFLRTLSARISRRFRDRVTIMLEAHVARLQATVATVEHHERRDYLDRLSVLRKQVFVLDHMYMSLFSTCGWILRLVVTIALLMSINPLLALLVLFAVPTVISSSWRPGVERQTEEKNASHQRLADHLFRTATSPAPGKDVRVTGIGPSLVTDRRSEWERWYGPIARVRWTSAGWHAAAWAIFGAGYVAAVLFVATGLDASVGAVLLILAAGARLSSYIGATVGEIGFLRGIWLDGSRRLVWLENYAASFDLDADLPVPSRLVDGIRLEGVSFRYAGAEKVALDNVSLHLPARKVIAVVGENGAGKSTLVKLIAKLYEPTSGRILLDGQPLARIPADAWRDRIAGAFQDFFRFEFQARHSVGLGDLPRLDDEAAVTAAVGRAGADDVVERLEEGLDTQLGSTWPGGAEISFGQWQKLALARGFMRDKPLLLVLDEPTAALDAETEHALFERYAEAARSSTDGRITVLVSHRFSTVRMADLIIVLDGAHVIETGTHNSLMTLGGHYADLYNLQATAYR